MSRSRDLARMLRGSAILLSVALAGCSSIGPTRLLEDRLDYARVISDAGKRQTLYNIVRLRYGEPPTFLALNQVVSSYALQGGGQVGAEIHPSSAAYTFWTAAVRGEYADRPTFTLTPVTGENFVNAYLRPLPPSVLLQLADAGAPIDIMLRIFARSVGRLQNTHSLGGGQRSGSADFLPMLADLRRLQDAGALRITATNGGRDARAGIAIDVAHAPSLRPVAARVQRMLGVDPGARDVSVVYGQGSRPQSGREIPLLTRSLLGALLAVAVSIDLPDEDVRSSRALPTVHEPGRPKPVIVIRSGPSRPARSYVEIQTDGRWFWIEDADIDSKMGFTVLELLKAIAESTRGQSVPVLTIPAG